MKSADDVERLSSIPIIGHIFEEGEGKNEENRLYDADDPHHPIAEAFRALRTNIGMSQAECASIQNGWESRRAYLWRQPPNPTELLRSKNTDQLLSKLEETADVVIIDRHPFIVADTTVMASKVDGVLLVVRPGHTPGPRHEVLQNRSGGPEPG